MKTFTRGLLAALMIVLTAGVSHAQFRIGPRAGITVNKLHLTDAAANFDSSNRCGFTGGVITEFTVPLIGIGMDASLMYARMNSEISTENGAQTSAKNFFEIPINVKYKLGIPVISKYLSPYIYTGPSFAFRLGKDENPIKQKSFQWAWNIGIGVELIQHLQVGAGYGFGINSILEKTNVVGSTDKSIKAKNNYWTITAAWLF